MIVSQVMNDSHIRILLYDRFHKGVYADSNKKATKH